jgi:hypothetical protein
MFEKLNAKNKKKPGFLARTFSTHPQPPDRVEATRSLVSRFPERDEYVLSTSEFQRVKNRLMRLSNSRASSSGSIAPGDDGTAPGRPTLKRRQPTPDDPNSPTTDGTETEQKDAPPQLKRRQPDNSNTSTNPPTGNQP